MFEPQSSGLPDYDNYKMSGRETAITCMGAVFAMVMAAWLCYGNIWYTFFLLPLIPLIIRRRKNKLNEVRRWKLNTSFCDAIRAMSAALESGYSVENSISEAYRDLSSDYSEQDMIMLELKAVISKVGNGIPVEDAFLWLGRRSRVEDILSFADVFATAKRTGGNVIAIIRSTAEMIRNRTEMKRELQILVAAKKYESDIMKAVPPGILLYMKAFSPDMIAGLYGSMGGVLTMTVMLAVYIVLCLAADKIVEIKL